MLVVKTLQYQQHHNAHVFCNQSCIKPRFVRLFPSLAAFDGLPVQSEVLVLRGSCRGYGFVSSVSGVHRFSPTHKLAYLTEFLSCRSAEGSISSLWTRWIHQLPQKFIFIRSYLDMHAICVVETISREKIIFFCLKFMAENLLFSPTHEIQAFVFCSLSVLRHWIKIPREISVPFFWL